MATCCRRSTNLQLDGGLKCQRQGCDGRRDPFQLRRLGHAAACLEYVEEQNVKRPGGEEKGLRSHLGGCSALLEGINHCHMGADGYQYQAETTRLPGTGNDRSDGGHQHRQHASGSSDSIQY